jgi:hypothetical protein
MPEELGAQDEGITAAGNKPATPAPWYGANFPLAA